ncbi:MAG TPA: sulfatase-like hydrolase/transferase [Verrucomicrobiales bacterium]|jgi:arylsulfatase A-like enzyme|nr:sulfatase-like hydrolase/transferase [Verrucomicrobiales bacterium]
MLFRLLTALFILTFSALLSAAPRKNVLFIFSDDQRSDTIRALGNEHIETPNLDSLVRRGTAFTRAYCMGGMQGAVCVPSRAMLMTSRSLWRIDEQMKSQPTWPQQFTAAGYAAFITGKWHNGQESLLRSFPSGGAIFTGGMGDPFKLPFQDVTAEHRLTKRAPKPGKHAVEEIADTAISFLTNHPKDKPFLLYVAMEAPHDPRTAPPEYHKKYLSALPPLPPDFLPLHPFDNGEMTVRDEKLAPWPRTPDNIRSELADYYALITFMDAQIGRILAALEKSGALQDTIVVFSSDQGLALGSHGLMGKQNLYESGMKVPLIFAGPDIPAGQRRDALCYLIDVYPTLAELTGVNSLAASEGISLAGIISGKTASIRSHILTGYRNVQRALTDGRWKLIRYPQVNVTQLFDLQSDPNELKDLSSLPDHAATQSALLAELRRQQTLHGDTLPLEVAKPSAPEWTPPAK